MRRIRQSDGLLKSLTTLAEALGVSPVFVKRMKWAGFLWRGALDCSVGTRVAEGAPGLQTVALDKTAPRCRTSGGGQALVNRMAAWSITAETGDFNSAVQYAAQALVVKGISPDSTKLFQQHLASFQQHKPVGL